MRHGMQMVVQLSPVVKKLIIINVAVWLGGVVILQRFVPEFSSWFGLVPARFLLDFWLWQPITYMFIHSTQLFHILFNMLLLWWLGSELEYRWGSRFFLTYYLASGIGAAIIYTIGLLVYWMFTGNSVPLTIPVVGASGAVFGLMLAYALIFGDRVMYFMMLFPMKAKYMVQLLGIIEVVTLMNSGLSGEVANLAHLGGLISGFLFLTIYTKTKQNKSRKKKAKKNQSNLKLVVDNEKDDSPRYWN